MRDLIWLRVRYGGFSGGTCVKCEGVGNGLDSAERPKPIFGKDKKRGNFVNLTLWGM